MMQTSQQNSVSRERIEGNDGRETKDEGRVKLSPSSFRPPSVVHRNVRPRATPRQRLIAALLSAAIVAFFGVFAVAGHYEVDMGRWLGYCGLQQTTGLPCPTCGWTTAALTFAQGRIFEAFYIQPAGALICSVMVVVALLAFVVAVSGIYFHFIQRFFTEIKIRYILLALFFIITAGWAVTLARALAMKM
ncbi:MAG: DUF2752 domain-containing protein [Sedimentisphaerales bacterium]|nr:DUF2752 domain-containing protein [Sedimentisphaerales bacterium]